MLAGFGRLPHGHHVGFLVGRDGRLSDVRFLFIFARIGRRYASVANTES